MSDKCEYVYIGGMRVPMENVLITFVPWNQRSAMTQSFRVVGASPGRDRGDPPYIQTISELKKLLKNNYNSKMVVNVYDPKTKSSVGEPFEFNPSKAQGRAGRRHAVKEGCSAVWSQFEPDEFVAEILAKGVSYGVSEGLDDINTAQLDWLARTPAGVTVLDNILNSTDPSMIDIKCTLAAVAADTATIVPLSSKIAEAFSKLAPLAIALGFGPETPAPPYDDEDYEDIAKNPSTPVDVLRTLASDENEYVRGGVARNPSTPVDLLTIQASDARSYVRGGVARNPSTPVSLLTILASDADMRVRRGATENPSTPADSLRTLASDADEVVRGGAAANPSTPVEVLRTLASDEGDYVRWGVALNPSTPVDLLTILASDADERVRASVSTNPSTPVDVLRKLTSDEYVNVHIYRRLQASFESAADEDEMSDEMSDEDVEYYAKQDAIEWRHRDEGTGAYAYDPNAELRAAEELRAAAKKLGIADDVALGIMTTDTVKFAVAPAEAAKTYKIGDAGPAGGTIYAIKSGMYLEVAPEDIGRLTWRDAMSAAQNYEHNGFSDWYLPSQNELDAMYEKRDMIGGLSTDCYWSSSERAGGHAWYQKFFNYGDKNYNGKYFAYSVRPVRAFSI